MATPHQTPSKFVSPDLAPNITASHASAPATQAAHGVPPVPGSNAQRSEPELVRDTPAHNNAPARHASRGLPDASPRTANASERTSSSSSSSSSLPSQPVDPAGALQPLRTASALRDDADSISPRQRWAHNLVLDMLKANLPLPALAAHLKIPFLTLIEYINTPEVQAEIDAYDALINLRARLIGQTARPVSLRKLLDVLESPAPRPCGRDVDADQRALHRHAELIRRTATTIARESRALAPKPVLAPKPSAATRPAADQRARKGAPSAQQQTSSGTSSGDSSNTGSDRARQEVPPVPSDPAPQGEADRVQDMPPPPAPPTPPTPANTPGRTEPPARQSPTDALRAAAGSTHALRDPSRRARDRPAA